MPKTYDQACPIARTLDIVGDRWTLLILRDLFLGSSRFSQFLQSSPGIPPKLLSGRLKKLEQHGIIERVVYSRYPLRAEYRLTAEGQTLAPVIEAVFRWGMEHCFGGSDELRDAIERKFTAAVERVRQPSGPSPAAV